MMKQTKAQFAIVTPSYNQAEYISQTIDSILSQHLPTHYWVIDGQSSDETTQILKKYPDLNWISEPDKGQTDAINKGVKRLLKDIPEDKQHNTYFAYINSDDFYQPQTFSQVAQAFEKNQTKHWLVGDAVIVDEQNQEIQVPIRLYKQLLRLFPLSSILPVLNPVPQPAVFIRLSAIKKVGLFSTQLSYVMDYEYWWRLIKEVGEPIRIHSPLAAFRIHAQSKGTTAFDKQFQEQLQIATQFRASSLQLLLHKLHNWLIVGIYSLIK